MHQATQPEFMFLVVGYDWDKNLAPADARQAIDNMLAWADSLQKQGIAASSSPLARMGKIVSGKHGSSVADGPFAEAKEVVGGYLIVRADDLDAAVEIARQCPILEHGVRLDVRPMVNECSIATSLREQAALASV